MSRALAIALLLAAAQPAAALSCLRPDVARSFQTADAADATYAVLLGSIFFETPVTGAGRYSAHADGRLLGPDGFATPYAGPVTLDVTCTMDICGDPGKSGSRAIAFLRVTDDGPTLDVGPCPEWLFLSPDASQVATLGDCFTGGACAPD